MKKACSNSRRAKASNVKAAGGCTGAVGALVANGDSTALMRVDTMRDTGSTGVAAADCVVDANDDTPAATGRVKSRLLSRTVGSAAGALTTAGFGLAFAGVEPDPG